jgi:hypothetical protein
MATEFIFEDVEIREEDITDNMIREECITYLLDRLSVSKYLRENITIAESERLAAWIKELDVDTALGLVFSEYAPGSEWDPAMQKGKLRKAAAAIGKGAKAVGGGIKKGAVAVGKGVKTGAVAVGKGAKTAGKFVGGKTVAGGKWAKANPVKAGVIVAGTIAAGLAGRALYKRLTDQCTKACKGSSDPNCVVKCRQAAKAKTQQATA